MVKLKYNDFKGTYSLKGLSNDNLAVLSGLLTHTVLGIEDLPNAAFEVLNVLEQNEIDSCHVECDVDEDGYFALTVE